VDVVDDGGAGGASDAVVVGFADAAEGGDVGADEKVLGEVCGGGQPMLGWSAVAVV